MKDSPEAPRAPDPYASAATQQQFNQTNQFTPYGSLTYSGGPNAAQAAEIGRLNQRLGNLSVGSPQYQQTLAQIQALHSAAGERSANLNLTPEMQALFGQQQEFSSNSLADALRRQGNLPQDALQYQSRDFSADSQQAQDATFQRMRGLLDPVFNEREQRLTQSLADRGLPTGSEIYNDERDVEGRSRNEAYNNAALDAIGAGNARESQLFGQNLQDFGAQQGARQGQFNELAALLQGQQVNPQQVQLGGFQMGAPGDFLGAQANQLAQQNSNYQNQLNSQNAMWGGLAGIASAGLGGWLGGG